MNLYILTQDINNDYDTYDSCVVCAENEEEARNIHPSGDNSQFSDPISRWGYIGTWVREEDKDKIQVEFIGTAVEGLPKGVVLASFNAG